MLSHRHLQDDSHGADDRPVSFADHYCRRHGIYREGFMLAVLQQTLPPVFSPWFSLILFFRPEYFTADFGFIVAVGRGRRYADYDQAVREFSAHPANRGFLRRWLRLRVSTRRMRRLLREIYVQKFRVLPGDDESGSFAPFDHRVDAVERGRPSVAISQHLPYVQN